MEEKKWKKRRRGSDFLPSGFWRPNGTATFYCFDMVLQKHVKYCNTKNWLQKEKYPLTIWIVNCSGLTTKLLPTNMVLFFRTNSFYLNERLHKLWVAATVAGVWIDIGCFFGSIVNIFFFSLSDCSTGLVWRTIFQWTYRRIRNTSSSFFLNESMRK